MEETQKGRGEGRYPQTETEIFFHGKNDLACDSGGRKPAPEGKSDRSEGNSLRLENYSGASCGDGGEGQGRQGYRKDGAGASLSLNRRRRWGPGSEDVRGSLPYESPH